MSEVLRDLCLLLPRTFYGDSVTRHHGFEDADLREQRFVQCGLGLGGLAPAGGDPEKTERMEQSLRQPHHRQDCT